jgi:pyruvate dehydrogenase E1 component
LDGPVRGNGKIIQELEGYFRGAGWNVIKVVWGRHWDPLFAKDKKGLMQRAMDSTVDGEYQNFKAKGGKYVRDNFFAKDPELLQMVEHLSDDDIYRLNRGGHDPYKVYAAYHAAVNHTGQPTVILAKTVKGYGMGDAGESENTTHQVKKLSLDELKHFRDRFDVPLRDEELEDVPYYRPAADSSEMQYMHQCRERLGGTMPRRLVDQQTLAIPALSAFKAQLEGSGKREISSTMAFVRILATLVRDKELGKRVVPIVPDEARTFGMEGMFRQLGIYSSEGQLYEPEDSDELAAYKESKSGQVLEEGINEAGAFAAWIAAATSYSTHQYTLLPFYVYYSMFGFQRVGDLAWAAGDLQAKGFLLGGTAGRTTLNGEGLQHQDGHSHLLASTVPNCISYDPAYAFELAVIIRRGLEHMYVEQAPVYYYLTLMNEAYQHPAMPEGVEDDIVQGMYLLETLGDSAAPRVRILGSGALLPEARRAAQQLVDTHGLQVQVYSVTSYTELARNIQDHQRETLIQAQTQAQATSCHVSSLLNEEEWGDAPVIAVSDYVKALPEQLRAAINAPLRVLGTDGFGRSDTREKLRAFFEVDSRFIQYSALSELVAIGHMQLNLQDLREQLEIASDKPNPREH